MTERLLTYHRNCVQKFSQYNASGTDVYWKKTMWIQKV